MAMERVVFVVLLACSLIAMASAVPGTATFYTPHVPLSCFGSQDQGTMIAAVNARLFANRVNCGRRLRVRCTGGTNTVPHPSRNGEITVRIVDLCPGCGTNQIDLSREAFVRIGNPDAGRIRIEYTLV